jgi:Ca2+/Na+ antiporter
MKLTHTAGPAAGCCHARRCILSPPASEFRKVEQIKVFACTSAFSVLAYVWLVVVLELWTPDEVTVFEALLTLLCFPLLVYVSYKIDQFEVAAARRKKHRVETQAALKVNPPPGHAAAAITAAARCWQLLLAAAGCWLLLPPPPSPLPLMLTTRFAGWLALPPPQPEGWVGFAATGEGEDGVPPLRVLDEQGEVVSNRSEIAQLLGSMSEADPVKAAEALMAQLPSPPITNIQARINACAKTVLFVYLFVYLFLNAQNDRFAKTGSGQT